MNRDLIIRCVREFGPTPIELPEGVRASGVIRRRDGLIEAVDWPPLQFLVRVDPDAVVLEKTIAVRVSENQEWLEVDHGAWCLIEVGDRLDIAESGGWPLE